MNKQELTINTLRVLSVEAVQKANSGHPGICLGAAPMIYSLYSNIMSHNPSNHKWVNRDRFVLSSGHGSALLYSVLHVFGYGTTKEDLQNFRQYGYASPGHPEYGHTVGVETSTGPLGQGIANAVGMAQAESILAKRFNKHDTKIVDHYTYCICGDGDMMEGIESEAASLAGTWGLGKLIVLYDSNSITIEGSTDIAFGEDVARRHEAQGWQVLKVSDGTDVCAITAAVNYAKTEKNKPSLIIVSTVIGYGSGNAGTPEVHGTPLGDKGVTALKEYLGHNYAPFEVPKEVAEYVADKKKVFAEYESEWNRTLTKYKKEYPNDYKEYTRWLSDVAVASKGSKTKGDDRFEIDFDALGIYDCDTRPDATRNSSGIVLNKLARAIPKLIGGSADLAPSNKTWLEGESGYGTNNRLGRNIHYGIREHAMASIANGMNLHGGFVNYVATFFVFSDYLKHSIRMASIMKLPLLYILTHDSIGVGEDGPTHQPIEQLTALRTIPNLRVFRPADYKETAAGYELWLSGGAPVAIVLSRQNLVQLPTSGKSALSGGYIASKSASGKVDMILIATGSEVSIAIEAQKKLESKGVSANVVSMPCVELFESQTAAYKETILPSSIKKRVAIEAGSTLGWYKYVGLDGDVVGIDSFGVSGKPDRIFEHFGITVDNVVNKCIAVNNKK